MIAQWYLCSIKGNRGCRERWTKKTAGLPQTLRVVGANPKKGQVFLNLTVNVYSLASNPLGQAREPWLLSPRCFIADGSSA